MREYTKSAIVNYRETDRFFHLRPDAFVQMLNTSSMYHTVSLGMQPGYMEERGLVWVLYSWKIHLEDGNQYAKKLDFTTFAVFHKEIYSHRYFYVRDEAGKIIGYAISVWIVIDMDKRKMVKIPADVEKMYTGGLSEPFSALQEEIAGKLDPSPLKKRRSPDFTHERIIPLRFHDIDSNRHVNNTVYVEWALESLRTEEDEDFLLAHCMSDLSIVYKREKKAGGAVKVRVMLDGLSSYHEILDEEECLLCLVEMTWKKRN